MALTPVAVNQKVNFVQWDGTNDTDILALTPTGTEPQFSIDGTPKELTVTNWGNVQGVYPVGSYVGVFVNDAGTVTGANGVMTTDDYHANYSPAPAWPA